MKCVAYVRTSNEEHSEYYLGMQMEAVEEYIDNQDWQLSKVYQEIASGLNVGLKEVIKEAQDGKIDVIIAATATRLFRSYDQVIPLQELCQQHKVDIITLDNSINTFEGNWGLI